MSSIRSSGRKTYRAQLHTALWCGLVVMMLGIGTAKVLAQWVEQQRLTASDAGSRKNFGISVSVSGDTAMVGASNADCPDGTALRCGAVYVFRSNGKTWIEEQKLAASDAGIAHRFGFTVRVSGDTAVIGAPTNDCGSGDSCGSAYVFRFNGTSWVEEQKLTGSDAGGRFGSSVALSGQTVVVGAYRLGCAAGNACGAAYVFRFDGTTWIEEQKLTPSGEQADQGFGGSVSVSGDTIVIGASKYDYGGAPHWSGAAFVFRFDGTEWVEEKMLAASDAESGDSFGGSVAVDGELAFVGAALDDCPDRYGYCGAVYVFRFNGAGWVEEQKLTAPDTAHSGYGRPVSVSGDTLLVRSLKECSAQNSCGVVNVLRFDTTHWIWEQELTGSLGNQAFSAGSLSVSANTALVGSSSEDCAAGDRCGAAYVFSRAVVPAVANLDIKPESCPSPLNPRSKGVVPVAIVGSAEFDVAMVNLDSLTLSRVDGVGESVSPLTGPRGPRIDVEDVATPFDGELCDCHGQGGDGIDDLTLKFSTIEMARALELNATERGETVELVLRGSLFDETTFEASDCIVIRGKHNAAPVLRRNKR